MTFPALALMAVCFPFSFALFNIGVAIICVSFVIRRFIFRKPGVYDPFLDIALILYLIISALSVFQSDHVPMTLEGIQKLFRYLLLFAAARDAVSRTGTTNRIVCVFLSGGAIAAADTLLQWIVGQDLLARRTPMPGLSGLVRLTGPFVNPNTLAIYLVYFLPLTYLMFRSAASARARLGYGILFLALLISLAMTFSRPAAIALAFSAFIIMLFKKDYKILAAGAVLLTAGIFLAPADVRAWLFSLDSWTGFFQDSSRALHHKAAWNMITANLYFGVGLNTFDVNYAAYRDASDTISRWSAHQAYLQIWAETGIAGFAAFLALIAGILTAAIRGIRNAADPFLKDSLLGFTLGVVCFLIIGFFESNFWQPRQTYYFWLWAGTLCGMAAFAGKKHA